MMDKEKLMQKYFYGNLNKEEEKQFSSFLREDVQFKRQFELELEKEVRSVIQHEERSRLKARLQALEKREDLRMPPRPKPWGLYAIAASIALLLGAIWYFGLLNDNLRYFNDYYNTYPNTEMIITRDMPQTLETDAFSAYDMENFEQAAALFEQLNNKSTADYVDFYLGQSYLHLGKTDQAIAAFKNTIAQNEKYSSEALWYLALAHLKNKDKESAKEALQTLISKKGYKAVEARKLLQQLK